MPAARNVGRCINTRHTGTCAAQAALDSLNPTTLRALSNYEIFHGLLAGIASVGEVARSCAGVHGWAAWVPLQLKLAFAMGTHARLGAGAAEGQGCPYLMMPADLFERVVEVWIEESFWWHPHRQPQAPFLSEEEEVDLFLFNDTKLRSRVCRGGLEFVC